MGTFEEFAAVYRDDGLLPAAGWVARNAALSVFHTSAYALVDVCSPLVLDRAALQRRLRANGSLQRYGREREVDIGLPAGEDHVDTFAERVGTYTISRPFVGAVRNARLVGAYPVPLASDGRVVLEGLVSPEVLALNVASSALDCVRDPPRGLPTGGPSVESAVLLFNRWNDGYYHWTVETLTRLEGVERYAERTGERPKLVVGPEPTGFQLESLSLLGYDGSDLLPWDRRLGRVDRLVVPSVRRELNPGEVSPVAYRWLRERMRRAAAEEVADGEFSKYVYVSREDAPRRQVRNEDEVLAVLRRYGFEKYVLTDHSVAENVALFAGADVVVAPHGAGLTNLVYADDASVVELFRANDVRPEYFVLSEQVGHEYRYLLCDYEGPDLVVDTAALEAVLARAMADELPGTA